MKPETQRSVKWLAVAIGTVFLGIQFMRPRLTDHPVTAEIRAPLPVRQILRKSCYSCHSNETRLSWFDRVVPAYWLVASDVHTARSRLNFSEIGQLPPDEQRSILFQAVNKIELGAMPLPSYAALHPQAAVTSEDLAVLRAYLNPPSEQSSDIVSFNSSSPSEPARSSLGAVRSKVRPAPNGIEFIPDYKNWQTISSTDRFDNNSVRVVLGNDVAIKAISLNHINPWPDGTILAKVVWEKRDDGAGIQRAGKLLHIAFMIRDHKKYSATKNWGYAWWNGEELNPLGKDASFANNCVACHAPLRRNDYVFTTPIGR